MYLCSCLRRRVLISCGTMAELSAAMAASLVYQVIHAVLTNPGRLLSTVLLGAICLWGEC
jgi:hypothetical protein